MNLFIRRLLVWIRAWLNQGSTEIGKVHELSFRVWPGDQDIFFHMTNSRYQSFADLGAMNFMRRTGLSRIAKQLGAEPTWASSDRHILKLLKTPQQFTLRTSYDGHEGDFLALRHQFLKNGREHASVLSLYQFVSQTGPVELADMLAALGSDATAVPREVTAAARSLIELARA